MIWFIWGYSTAHNPFCLCRNVPRGRINTTNLLTHYIIACGFGYLCDDTIHEDYKFVKTRFPNCPPCVCDDLCFIAGNCCPDKYFTKYPALRSILLMGAPEKEDMKMNFIDKCPEETSTNDRMECEKERGTIERLFSPPSMSIYGSKVYWNQYCAICHGEKEEKLEFWKLFINTECDKRMFYLSSWEEIVDFATSSNCYLGHSPYNMNPILPSEDDRCTNYKDNDITRACKSSYALKYGTFGNIFCVMCNPFEEIDESNLISSCHSDVRQPSQTYMEWQTLNKLCNYSGRSDLTYPYKNVFCYICNMRFSAKSGAYGNILHDAKGNTFVLEQKMAQNEFEMLVRNITITDLNWTHQYINKTAELRLNDVTTHGQDLLNITNLEKLFYASTKTKFCEGSILPHASRDTRNCTCNPSCIFGDVRKCCFGTLITTPLKCIRENNFFKGDLYMVINGCTNKKLKSEDPLKYSTLEYLCRNELDFPIEINRISYRNIFCLLCNEGKYDIVNIRPWPFILRCPTQIPLAYSVDLMSSIAKEARRKRCTFDFDTSMAYRCSNPGPLCTYFGDESITQACEHTGFKFLSHGMEFCEMCRHPPLRQTLRTNCTPSSPQYSQILRRQCEEFPAVNIYKFGEYKNRFCFECNVLSHSQRPPLLGVRTNMGTAKHFQENTKASMHRVLSELPTTVQVPNYI